MYLLSIWGKKLSNMKSNIPEHEIKKIYLIRTSYKDQEGTLDLWSFCFVFRAILEDHCLV